MDNAIRKISADELNDLFDTGEFPPSIRQAADRVLVVMTQSWCPQWTSMEYWLPTVAEEAAVFALVYDSHPRFTEIRQFKENVFGNRSVPYLRFYVNGNLVSESNYLPLGKVRDLLGLGT